MRTKKFLKIITILVLILASVITGTIDISATNINYSYYIPYEGAEWYLYLPLAYETTKTITYIDGLEKQLSSPGDLFIAENGNIYIVDTNESRVVILTKDGKLVKEVNGNDYGEYSDEEYEAIKKLNDEKYAEERAANNEIKKKKDREVEEKYKNGDYNKREYNNALQKNKEEYDNKEARIKHYERVESAKHKSPMSKPEGIYVDEDGDMYIADTQNSRILHLDPDGKYIEMFVEPEHETFDYVEYPFRPSKVSLDAVGRIYTINYMDFHGFITLDEYNNFLGYVAQTKIDYSLWYNLVKTIYSKDVLEKIFPRITPEYFSNFVISKYDNLIYSVSRNDNKNQIKKLNPAGNNVYHEGQYGFVDQQGTEPDEIFYADYIDIAVGSSGLIYAADANMQTVDVYDQEGHNMMTLGMPNGWGSGGGGYKGSFTQISAIDVDRDGVLYVLDKDRNVIQVMEPTRFMDKVLEATEYYSNGLYEEALGPWEEVLAMHNTYAHAVKGIAKAKYGQTKYKEAMALSILAYDPDGYSEAFNEYRINYFRDNFLLVITIMLVIAVGLLFLLGYLRRLSAKVDLVYDYSADKYGIKIFLHTLLLIIFHPIDGFTKLKVNREKYKIWSIVLMVVAIIIVNISYVYIAHFPLSDNLPQYTDFLRQVLSFILPIAAWIIVGFAITSISSGKTTFKETCVSVLYSFVPYIILTLPLGLLSNILSAGDAGLYNSLKLIVLGWCFALLLLSLMNLNEYSFKQMTGNTLKILFALVCIVMIFGMVYVIISQFVTFVEEVNVEILYLSNK